LDAKLELMQLCKDFLRKREVEESTERSSLEYAEWTVLDLFLAKELR
jgi:hypothetical protein